MKGRIVYATEQARKKHEGRESELEMKRKVPRCPACELDLARKSATHIDEAISDELLESNH
jgi:uncharacterized protein with PIN domain